MLQVVPTTFVGTFYLKPLRKLKKETSHRYTRVQQNVPMLSYFHICLPMFIWAYIVAESKFSSYFIGKVNSTLTPDTTKTTSHCSVMQY